MGPAFIFNGELRLRWLPVLLLLPSAFPAAAEPTLRWVSNPEIPCQAWVEVAPLENFSLPTSKEAQNKLLSVRVANSAAARHLPMAGSHSFAKGTLKFRPLFPLDPGLRYTAKYKLLSASITAPKRPPGPPNKVTRVTPSTGILPLNLLKFYLHFSAPMTRGDSYEHIHLHDRKGRRVADPFLELPEELWNPGMTRLTALLDPGRIKRGLLPNQELGAVFEKDQPYTLSIDRAWKDATGQPLGQSFTKSFRASAPDYEQPHPKKWRFTYPAAGTREPLRISFGEPLDAALAARFLTVNLPSNISLEGITSLSAQESIWEFHPTKPWAALPHELRIDHRLEDLAGNSIERLFEEGLDKHPERAGAPPAHSLHKFSPKSPK